MAKFCQFLTELSAGDMIMAGYYRFLLYCPPPFRRKAGGHCFWFSVVRGSEFLVGTLSP